VQRSSQDIVSFETPSGEWKQPYCCGLFQAAKGRMVRGFFVGVMQINKVQKL